MGATVRVPSLPVAAPVATAHWHVYLIEKERNIQQGVTQAAKKKTGVWKKKAYRY